MDLRKVDYWKKQLGPEFESLSLDSKRNSHVAFRAKYKHRHHTWAKTFFFKPELFIQPESVEEIQLLVNLARQYKKKIIVTGASHSPSDLTVTSGWLVNLDKFQKLVSIDENTRQVTVEAGIRLYNLNKALHAHGWQMPTLGSIDDQSLAGCMATGTHGSSMEHGLISDGVVSLRIALADGSIRECSDSKDPDLYYAALVSLGGLGVITHATFQAVPRFKLRWTQEIVTFPRLLEEWENGLWTRAEFARAWWYPYSGRTIVWHAEKVDLATPTTEPPHSWWGTKFGFHIYQSLLYLTHWFPSLYPSVERFAFRRQFGWEDGKKVSAVQDGHAALLLDCLFSQHVNEWALPLSSGPEALTALADWINHPDPSTSSSTAPITASSYPHPSKGLYPHSPVEIRVASSNRPPHQTARPFLDPSDIPEPTLYLNAIMYRPYHIDTPGTRAYYEAFEWLMRQFNGRPHWAKNFQSLTGSKEVEAMYGDKLEEWRAVKARVDPANVFGGQWLERYILPAASAESTPPPVSLSTSTESFAVVENE